MVGSKRADDYVAQLYDELRRVAAAKLAAERPDHTLQPTALVHEVYLKFLSSSRDTWESKQDFMAAAAEAMRRILVDSARTRKRLKRGGKDLQRISLDNIDPAQGSPDDDRVLAIDDGLEALRAIAPEKAQVVVLRYFLGLSIDEIADLQGVSRSTVIRRWNFARAWIIRRIRQQSDKSR